MSAREIPLTQNKVALVDDGDYGYLSQFHWYAHWNPNTQSFYANSLDNRRSNLRIVTHNQQAQNRQGQRRCASGFKGVKKTSSGRFQAEIVANGKRLYLGLRDTAELAYRELYEPAAKRFHREYAGGMR